MLLVMWHRKKKHHIFTSSIKDSVSGTERKNKRNMQLSLLKGCAKMPISNNDQMCIHDGKCTA